MSSPASSGSSSIVGSATKEHSIRISSSQSRDHIHTYTYTHTHTKFIFFWQMTWGAANEMQSIFLWFSKSYLLGWDCRITWKLKEIISTQVQEVALWNQPLCDEILLGFERMEWWWTIAPFGERGSFFGTGTSKNFMSSASKFLLMNDIG